MKIIKNDFLPLYILCNLCKMIVLIAYFFPLNCFAVIKGKRRLFKRQVLRTETTPVYYFNRTCKSMKANNGQIDWSSLEDCKDENNLWDVACTFKDGLCFYFVTCNYLGSPRKQWSCSETHDHSAIPVCCDLVCGHWNGIFLPIWFDLKRKVIRICYQIYRPFSVRFLFYKFKFLCDMHWVCIQNVYRWCLMQPLIINNATD